MDRRINVKVNRHFYMLGSELDSTTSEQFIDYESKGNGCTRSSLAMTSKKYDSLGAVGARIGVSSQVFLKCFHNEDEGVERDRC